MSRIQRCSLTTSVISMYMVGKNILIKRDFCEYYCVGNDLLITLTLAASLLGTMGY